MAGDFVRRRFTVAEYYCMAEAGILGRADHVELIDGEIVQMSPMGPAHAYHVGRVTRVFYATVGARAVIKVQVPLRLDEHSEPEPDVVLARPPEEAYAAAHPGPGDVLLVVEVSDSSVSYDQSVKAPLYARAGVPEYWSLNVPRQHLTAYVDPSPDGYRTARVLPRRDTVHPLAFPEVTIPVDDLLG